MDTKSEVLENFLLADQFINTAFPGLEKLDLVITGGASFLLKGFGSKYTLDIDTITKLDESIMEYLESFSINDMARQVTKISPSYESRLVSFDSGCNVINIQLLSNEDLVLTKIGRLNEKDIKDIIRTGILNRTDIRLLENLAFEIGQNDHDFMGKWEFFKRTVIGG